jgi:hypothetical protein
VERIIKESGKWEVYGSISVWQLIPRREISLHSILGWGKKNPYKRGRLIRRIEFMEVSQ